MPAYVVIVTGAVTDAEAYGQYMEKAMPTLEQYGAKFLMAGVPVEQLEGDWQPEAGIFMLEFDDVDKARTWYQSPEYTAARKLREGAITESQFIAEPPPEQG